MGNLRFRDGDTTEKGEDDDEGVEEGRDEKGWREGGECLAESDRGELDDKDHQELVTGARGARLKAGNVVEGKEKTDGWIEVNVLVRLVGTGSNWG